ncbi:hypothetical protein A2773_02810 [Candidatus Gottesmanbacteria bacterium RIFCSPHIGHO2_01_FULL_39_10]|uniref:Capsule polysaccharide biosynthesis protein n=1 Tax=Candidatus Gottesmanbacteria bacterium RIFCSPHIGHO2_01_FULL_39_10 TaxID=1798375 RepID=A0A1F5ZNU5_9BACT|nr:MAG: hypothetical protein A2773_02810 [Candidatus Gottesmanbacteria bacterium RIFCSPHIGHO2_01_FULL_39_10]
MKVLLPALNDTYHIDVISTLIKKGVAIDYLLTHRQDELKKLPEFAKTDILDETQFQYAYKVAHINKNNPESFDEKFIKDHRELESTFLAITDRLSFYPKTVHERKRIYYELLLYWFHFLKKHAITTIFFLYVPHLGYDNIIYALAKYLYLDVFIMRDTLYHKILLNTDFNATLDKVPQNFLNGLTMNQLKQKVGKDMLSMFFHTNELISFNIELNKITMKQNTMGLLSVFDFQTWKSLFALLHNPFEKADGSFLFLEKPSRWLDSYWMIVLYSVKTRSLLKYYETLVSPVDLSKKFIYFGLHYQPERTTLPEGGIFEDQLLAIDILAKSVPKDWIVYVKEHPSQLCRSDPRKMNFRDKAFYDKIVSYKNVKLIPMECSSQTLIQYNQCAVTLTGSVGWESLTVGKPIIVFSRSAWYASCNSCYVVHSVKECTVAISSIQTSTKIQVEKDVLTYLCYYKDKFLTGAFASEFTKNAKVSYSFLVEDLAKELMKRIFRKKKNNS